jgi:hypothetical protein
MTTTWNIIFEQGAEFQAQVTVSNWPATYPALSTATDWRLRVARAGETAYLTANTSNYITLNGAKTVGTFVIPSAITNAFPCGNALYDLDILFPSSVVKRLISLGSAQVNIYAGSV